jgi:hypothetical protein
VKERRTPGSARKGNASTVEARRERDDRPTRLSRRSVTPSTPHLVLRSLRIPLVERTLLLDVLVLVELTRNPRGQGGVTHRASLGRGLWDLHALDLHVAVPADARGRGRWDDVSRLHQGHSPRNVCGVQKEKQHSPRQAKRGLGVRGRRTRW